MFGSYLNDRFLAAVAASSVLALAAGCGSSNKGDLEIVTCSGTSGSSACGSSSLAVDNIALVANPNNALSAKATVTSHGAQSVQILYQPQSGGDVGTTPKVATQSGAQVVPVLALEANTPYRVQVLLTDASGKFARSTVQTLQTGAPPSDVSSLKFKVSNPGGETDGYFLVSRLQAMNYTGAVPYVIVDRTGKVVWYSDTGIGRGDFQHQADGTYTESVGTTAGVLSYNRLDALGNVLQSYVPPTPGEAADNHELKVLANGDVLFMGSPIQVVDLTSLGGSVTGNVEGNSLYRIQPDGTVSFHWSDLDHIPLAGLDTTFAHYTDSPVDWTHCNSVDVTSDGNYLVSSRHKDQVWKIDASTGAVLWKLGGVDSDFTFANDPLNGFSGQHFAREVAENDILIFDDGNSHPTPQSRAVEYKLDPVAKTATLVWSYSPTPSVFSVAMGSAQRLANGHTLVNFATASRVDEVDANGKLVWQLTDPTPAFGFYRVLYDASIY